MYTYFDKTKKVLCVIQAVEDAEAAITTWNSVMTHTDEEVIDTNQDGTDDNATGADATKDSVMDSE